MGKTPKKDKKEKDGSPDGEGDNYELLASRVNKISQPLAGKKLTKRIYKVARNAKGEMMMMMMKKKKKKKKKTAK